MEKVKISVLERILAKLHVFLSGIKGPLNVKKIPFDATFPARILSAQTKN